MQTNNQNTIPSVSTMFRHYKKLCDPSKVAPRVDFPTMEELSINDNGQEMFNGIIMFDNYPNSFIGIGVGKNQRDKYVDGYILENGNMFFSVRKKDCDTLDYFGHVGEEPFFQGTEVEKHAVSVTTKKIEDPDLICQHFIREGHRMLRQGVTRYDVAQRRVKIFKEIQAKKGA